MLKTLDPNIDLRQKIIDLHKAGNSYGDIYKRLDTPRSAVQSVIKKFAQFRTTEILLGRGWKRKLSPNSGRKQFREINYIPLMMLVNIADFKGFFLVDKRKRKVTLTRFNRCF